MRTALLLLLVGCVPWLSASPERQAESKGDSLDPYLGPAERDSVEAWREVRREREAERAADAAWRAEYAERQAAALQERTLAAADAWDLRLLDALAAQLDLTAQLAASVAERGETPALRDWARETASNADTWRVEIATLRGRWFGDPRPPRLVGPTDPATLAPITARIAERWQRGRGWPGSPTREEEAPALPASDSYAFAHLDTTALERTEAGLVPARVAAEALVPLARNALTLATTGTMQASRPDIRALAVRVQLGQQAALADLADLADRPRG